MRRESPHVLFVGINPGRSRPGGTLDRLSRWATVMGVHHYAFTNCFGHQVDHPRMKDVDWEWLTTVTRGHVVVALGSFPSRVLSRLGVDHFTLPHPSGLNRKLNDPEYVEAMLKMCRDYIRDGETTD